MSSNCITETSKACLKTFCINPLLPQPKPRTHPPNLETQTINPRCNFIKSIISSIQPNTTFTNHESLPSSTQLFSNLKNAFPHYLNTILADEIRAREYSHLSLSNRVCLDYIGNGLFSPSQVQHDNNNNPTAEIASSSSSSSSTAIHAPFFDISYKSVSLDSYNSQESEFESAMRKRIMKSMNLFEEDYFLIFTANQTSAMKLLACSYPFESNQKLLTVYDHENESVEAMIELGKNNGARPLSAVFSWPNLRVNSQKLRKLIIANKSKPKNKGLFVFPLQSRLTGSRYSHQWMNLARDNGWHVLLDACALGAKDMETLGLSLFQPDYIISSFYKIFGENPSGFCCLFIKKPSFSNLNKSSTNTGIISITPAKGPYKKRVIDQTEEQKTLVTEIEELDENQEPNNGIKLECHGLDHADTLGLIQISNRSRCLINWLVNALLCLKHPNSQTGIPLVIIYGPKIKLDRGPALAFNVHDWKGEKVDPLLVQRLADRNNISLSCGFLKNMWFSNDFHEKKEKLLENRKGMKKKKGERNGGIEVVSICTGMLSNFEDMYRVWGFVSRFLDADFVEKERWRYTALNQTAVEV